MDIIEVAVQLHEAQVAQGAPGDLSRPKAEGLDANMASTVALLESVGTSFEDAQAVVHSFVQWAITMQNEEAMRALSSGVIDPHAMHKTLSDSTFSVGLQCLMIGLYAGMGIDPRHDAEQTSPYHEDERVPVGGWITREGARLVRVLGLDAAERVVVEEDGELLEDRHSVGCFLDNHTRVDDVPVLGGDRAL